MGEVLLPTAFAVCAAVGVPHEECGGKMLQFKIMDAARQQTDPLKWYVSFASYPDKDGAPRDCMSAVPIYRYEIYDGSHGTTYACVPKTEDVAITDGDLARIGSLAARLNSIRPKTYADYEKALYLKNLVKALAP